MASVSAWMKAGCWYNRGVGKKTESLQKDKRRRLRSRSNDEDKANATLIETEFAQKDAADHLAIASAARSKIMKWRCATNGPNGGGTRQSWNRVNGTKDIRT